MISQYYRECGLGMGYGRLSIPVKVALGSLPTVI